MVAGVVHHNPARTTYDQTVQQVALHEELRELEEISPELIPTQQAFVRQIEESVHVSHHGDTRAGRRNNRIVAIEDLEHPLRQMHRLLWMTGVECGLAAAGLPWVVVNFDTQGFQKTYR